MFSVRPLCRHIIIFISVILLAGINYIFMDRIVAVLSVVIIIWLWLYLAGLKIEITEKYIIKHTGNIFKRESIVLLKNIFYVQVITLAPWRPAVIRFRSYGEKIFLIGLNGRQATFLKKAVKAQNKY